MLTFYFTGVEGKMTVPELLTSGMVGKELRLEFSEEWESLTKTVVFSNGEITLDRTCTGAVMVIPAQVLEKPLGQLTVGIYGVSADGTVVIPTVRAEGPAILPGVNPSGDPGVDPSLPVWAQLREMVEQMEDLVEEEKAKLVAAMDALSSRVGKSPTVAYYRSLAAAISDVNNGVSANTQTDREDAKVVVFTSHTGAKTVMLLGDVSEGAGITVNKDIDLVLNGKTLNLTTAASVLTFGAGTKCRINGEAPGSAIVKELTGATTNTNTILINGDELHICGGSYSLTGSNSGQNIAIKAGATCKLLEMVDATVEDTNTSTSARAIQTQAARTVLRGCTIHAVGGTSVADGLFGSGIKEVYNCKIRAKSGGTTGGYGIYDLTATDKQIIKNSDIHADAPDCHETVNSRGIYVQGQAFVENCTVHGTHSAITTRGELYIDGGVYTGFCHGGVYVSKNGMACINDATLQCGNYTGEFDYSNRSGEIYGSMYIGGNANANNLTAYLDGCSLVSPGSPCIVMRGSDGEHDNTIKISNSTLTGGIVRIDNDTLKLMVGAGTNITEYKIDNPRRAEFSENLYRKNSAEKILNGRDYAVLADRVWDSAGLVKSVGGVAADKNGNVPLDWLPTKTFQPKVILEETTVSGGFYSGLTYEKLEGQEELAVLCDGRLYLCVPEFGYAEGDGYFVYLGNKNLRTNTQTEAGEPFLVWGFKGTSLILIFRGGGEHTLSITGYEYVYNKLSIEYLPVEEIRKIVAEVMAEAQKN